MAADVMINYLLIVIQNDDHVCIKVTSVVHCLICHATSDCTVANHSDDVVGLALHITSYSHAETS